MRIPPAILDRGAQLYYADPSVVEILSQDRDVVQATVRGSKTYAVNLSLDDSGNLETWECTCPYDQGPVCKHVAALWIAVQEQGIKNRGT